MNPSDQRPDLPERALTEILSCALDTNEGPFDLLAARVTRADGDEWLRRCLASELFAGLQAEHWDREVPDPQVLEELKRRSKARIREESGDPKGDAAIAGTFGYLAANAASLAFHGAKISNLEDATLADQIADFGTVLPEPWCAWVARAIGVLRSRS